MDFALSHLQRSLGPQMTKEECTVLVRYDEIALKGNNRKFFINCLRDNIRKSLKSIKGARVETPHGRILVIGESNQAEAISDRLKLIPGIASFSVGVCVEPEMDLMAERGIQWIEPLMAGKDSFAFCVRTHRADKRFPMTSMEVDREVGGRIHNQLSERGLAVNIKRPDFSLEIEIGQERTILFHKRVKGLCGMPVGCAGEALGLISGGIDSPVALFKVMRRGCRMHGVFFDNRPYMGRGGYDKVLRLFARLNEFQGGGRLYVVPFENIQVAIRDHCKPANRVVLYRRMMYRISEALAREKRYLALVTGESLGQVASQTLENLDAVSRVVEGSVFRPLIGMDKKEIIEEAEQLGTYNISIEPQPDCCSVFMPPHPVTRAKISELELDEQGFPWKELMAEALGKLEIV